MKVGCMVYESLRYSNFECFFSESCFNQTATLISKLPPMLWPKPLNRSNLFRFTPNDTFDSILQQFMVEKWNNRTEFTGYFNSCSPSQCTYRAIWRNDFIFLISRLIGLFGGLSVSLRIISPMIIKVYHYIYVRLHSKRQRAADQNQFQIGTYTYTVEKKNLTNHEEIFNK